MCLSKFNMITFFLCVCLSQCFSEESLTYVLKTGSIKWKLCPLVNCNFPGNNQYIFFFWKPARCDTLNNVFSVKQTQKPTECDFQRDLMSVPCRRSEWCRSRPYLWADEASGTWCVCPAPGSAFLQRSCLWPWGTSTLHPAEPALLGGLPEAILTQKKRLQRVINKCGIIYLLDLPG